LGERFAVFSATYCSWNFRLSVTSAPVRSPHALHTFEVDSMLIRRPVTPGAERSVTPQMLAALSPV
jgi:hypothetical protein